MQLVESDLIRFEEIALLLSSTTSLPHYKYPNRNKRYNYIVPISNPTLIIVARVESIVVDPNSETPEGSVIPVCGEIWNIGGVETPICSYIAYSTWVDSRRISSQWEKVVSLLIEEAPAPETQKVLDCNMGTILKGIPLSATLNVIEFAKYKS